MTDNPLRLSCNVSLFPSFPENYVLWHIMELVRSGQMVDVLTDRFLPENAHLQPEIQLYNLLDLVVGHNAPSGSLRRRRLQAPLTAARALYRSPRIGAKAILSSLQGKGAGVLQALRHIERTPRPIRYDTSHAYFALPGRRLQILRDAGAIRGPIVVSFLGYDITSMPSYTPLSYYRPMFDRAEVLSVSSNYMMSQLERLGVDPNRITKLPIGLPIRYFDYTPRSDKYSSRLEIITAARLVEVKGLDVGLKALAILKHKDIDFHWHIYGNGDQRHMLEELRTSLKLENHVSFHGFKPLQDIREHMKSAHLAFYPGKRSKEGAEEAVGGSILEAQASGLPVITTTAGGAKEALQDGVSGFVGESENAEHLAALIRNFASIPERWEEMGAAGRTFIESTWDSEYLNSKWLALYRSLS